MRDNVILCFIFYIKITKSNKPFTTFIWAINVISYIKYKISKANKNFGKNCVYVFDNRNIFCSTMSV